MRRYAAKDNVIFKAVLWDLERFVRSETIIDKYAGFPVRSQLGLGIECELEPVEANIRVGVAGL